MLNIPQGNFISSLTNILWKTLPLVPIEHIAHVLPLIFHVSLSDREGNNKHILFLENQRFSRFPQTNSISSPTNFLYSLSNILYPRTISLSRIRLNS